MLVYANFPVALAAIPLAAIAIERLATAWAHALGLVAIALCAAVFWPGVVEQRDLDARPVNAVAAVGVALALGLTLAAARRCGLGLSARLRGDGVRLLAAALLLFLAVPWIAADLGFHFDGVPVLGSIWQTGELRGPPGVPPLVPAVHLGHHHGLDGVLLALTALALSRMRLGRAAAGVSLYLALMLAYGVGNVANDFWLEQVVKRGWIGWEIPSVLNPRLSWAWLAIVVSAALLWLVALRPSRNPPRSLSRSLR